MNHSQTPVSPPMQHPALSLGLAMLVLPLLAGCLADEADKPLPDYAFSDKPGFFECRASYDFDDDRPVDCEETIAVPMTETEPPAGWACIVEYSWVPQFFQIWTDGEGHYGYAWDMPPPDHYHSDAPVMIGATLGENESRQHIVLDGEDYGFVRFPDAAAPDSLYRFNIWLFELEGIESVNLTMDALRMMVTDYEGSMWFVWAIDVAPNRTAYWESMGMRWEGDDLITYAPDFAGRHLEGERADGSPYKVTFRSKELWPFGTIYEHMEPPEEDPVGDLLPVDTEEPVCQRGQAASGP